MRRAGQGSARGCRARRAAGCCVLESARVSAGRGTLAGGCAVSRQQRLQDLGHHRTNPQLACERQQLSRLGVCISKVCTQRRQSHVPSHARTQAQKIDDRALLRTDCNRLCRVNWLMNTSECKGVCREDMHPRWGVDDPRAMSAARNRNMNRSRHLVGQIPEAGRRVQADHAIRHPPTYRNEVQMSRRWEVSDTIDTARKLDQRPFIS